MSQQEAEEKTLPASEKKLRDARKKGQVSQGRDLISGVTLVGALGYVYYYVTSPSSFDDFNQLVQIVTETDNGTFSEVLGRAIRHAASIVLFATVPLVGIILLLSLLSGVIAIGGPVFSFEPIKPQFERINPAKGFKRLASLRNVVEFTKGLAKLVLLAAVFGVILLAWLQPIFEVPSCGQSCLAPMVYSVLTPLGVTAALAFLVIGLLDMPVQRWLFRRDMRMTKTEYRREYRDLEGDPLIRREFQRLRRETVTRTSKLGMRNAAFAIVAGDRIVALRYDKQDTPLPAIVSKGQGASAAQLLSEAGRMNIPVVHDPELLEGLFERCGVGDYIRPEFFGGVVKHLIQLELV